MLSSFKKNYVIGTKLFFLEKTIEYNAKASKYTELAYINHNVFNIYYKSIKEFLKCLTKFTKDSLAYHAVKETLLHNPLYNKIGEVCPICRSGHSIFKCHYVFY